jgi:hypothetical protein
VDLAAVYRRQLDGRILTLAPSGWTYDFTFVLFDQETGSLWYPDEKGLTAIQGPLFGRRLRIIPSYDTNWGQWRTGHPNSHILP